MKRFTLPRDIYFGKGSLEYLKTLEGKRAVLVIGGSTLRKHGYLDKILSYLEKAKIEVQLIENVEPDPSIETVMAGAKAMSNFNPDWIISAGGGSAIDAAKAMWIFYEYPDAQFEEISKPFNIPSLRHKARFIGIPTTSGTASEVTAFSVITDYSTKIKYPLADFEITPDVAIVDPELAYSMPKTLVANTGMDAITHATEAFLSTAHNDFTDPLALKAIEMIKDNIVNSYNGGIKAKDNMHIAQCLAGMAFSNALLGIVHSLAHKSGAVLEIPHGLANAIYLPYVLEYNSKTSMCRIAKIAKYLGLNGNDENELANSYIELIRDLNRKLEIPSSLLELGISEKLFMENLEYMAKNAYDDACTPSNPRKTTVEELKILLKNIFFGKKIDF